MVTDDKDIIDLDFLEDLLCRYEGSPLFMVDGFFAGIATLDQPIPQEKWYQIIGVSPDQIEDPEEAEQFTTTLSEYHKYIVLDLMNGNYVPIISEEDEAEQNSEDLQTAWKFWVMGYIEGLFLEGSQWIDELPQQLYYPIFTISLYPLPFEEAYATLEDTVEKKISESQFRKTLAQIPDIVEFIVNELFQFKHPEFAELRGGKEEHEHGCGCHSHDDHHHHHHHDQEHSPQNSPKIAQKIAGRNDPCPCGSGKKYKKCCLH